MKGLRQAGFGFLLRISVNLFVLAWPLFSSSATSSLSWSLFTTFVPGLSSGNPGSSICLGQCVLGSTVGCTFPTEGPSAVGEMGQKREACPADSDQWRDKPRIAESTLLRGHVQTK